MIKFEIVQNKQYGKFYIVSTPIGNMKDITFRAIEVLNNVDLIASEDTRRTINLLNFYNINKKLISYHKFNEKHRTDELIKFLKSGKSIALVSDAGTPLISDPGYIIIKKIIDENIDVEAIPGATALIDAVVLSGLSTEEFLFVGFLSTDNKKRREKLLSIKDYKMTLVFYISPYKLIKYLEEMVEIFGEDRKVALCRELTKKYEEVNRDSINLILNEYKNRDIKGEFVLVVQGKTQLEIDNEIENEYKNKLVYEQFEDLIKTGLSDKEAIKQISKKRNKTKSEIYKIIKIKGD